MDRHPPVLPLSLGTRPPVPVSNHGNRNKPRKCGGAVNPMNSSIARGALAVLLVAITAGARQPQVRQSTPPTTTAATTASIAMAAEAETRFALDLYAQLIEQGGNVVVSPLSVFSALAILHAGARGKTAAQIEGVLSVPEGAQGLVAGIAGLSRSLAADAESGRYRFELRHAIWVDRRFGFRPEYRSRIRGELGAEVNDAEFGPEADRIDQAVDAWMARTVRPATPAGNAAPDRGALNVVGPGSVLLVASAARFSAQWAGWFDESSTGDGVFHVSEGVTAKVSFMRPSHGYGWYGYHETAELQVLSLPYDGGTTAMLVLLPTKRDGLAALERTLAVGRLREWIAQLKPGQVRVEFPKFDFGYESGFDEALGRMGMPAAFSSEADFSAMVTNPLGLRLSAVAHRARITIDEYGTDAEAETRAGGVPGGISMYEKPKPHFRADHPFAFFIVDTRTGAVLFAGRVANPGASGRAA